MSEVRMSGFCRAKFVAACVLMGMLASEARCQVTRGRPVPSRVTRVDRAIQGGVKFLLSQITEDGSVQAETRSDDSRHAGRTAIAAYALLAAKVDPKTPELTRALEWLMNAKPFGTYAVSLRACAMAEWNGPKAMGVLGRDVDWLTRADGDDGAYTYTSQAGGKNGAFDNSNSQMAVLGVWAAYQRGMKIPEAYWRKVEAHWHRQQRHDGGWNYHSGSGGGGGGSYGSMTAAGLATLFITMDSLHSMDFARVGTTADYKPISDGLKWLGEHFSVKTNPQRGAHRYYWMYSLERVGLASGYKYFGGHNWYAEGARALISLQSEGGSWGSRRSLVSDTAFALLFLVRGRYPVLVNKLRYSGRWNGRPRDMANLVRWLSWNFERPVSWQVVDIDFPLSDWHDAPILYISGAGACEFSDKQVAKLREFVLQGGTILSEAAGNSGDFTLDMQKIYRRMFPGLKMQRLGDEHPIYNMYFQPSKSARRGAPGGLLGISNGVRSLVIHSPRELSLGLQEGYRPKTRPWFELLTNIYFLATDKGILSARGTTYWPTASAFEPAATIHITRVKHGGNYDPEPLAWKRLGIVMGNRYRLKLAVSDPVEIVRLDAMSHPLAVMTGTDAFTLSPEQAAALKKYLQGGGTLVIDAAGGSRTFDEAVYKQILSLLDNAEYGPIPANHPIYRWPEPAGQVTYRRGLAVALGAARREPRLRGILDGDRLAIIYSRDDLTAALVGYQFHGIRGYSPRSAVALMANIICYIARVSPRVTARPTTTRSATAPSQ